MIVELNTYGAPQAMGSTNVNKANRRLKRAQKRLNKLLKQEQKRTNRLARKATRTDRGDDFATKNNATIGSMLSSTVDTFSNAVASYIAPQSAVSDVPGMSGSIAPPFHPGMSGAYAATIAPTSWRGMRGDDDEDDDHLDDEDDEDSDDEDFDEDETLDDQEAEGLPRWVIPAAAALGGLLVVSAALK